MSTVLTEAQKVAHLYRRFGFGATPEEIEDGVKLGVDGVVDKLIAFESIDDKVPVSPWEVCFEEGREEIYLDAYRPATWWGLRMVMTARPLEEKLALFWHNHFAVSASKVEFGPMMLDYLQTIRAKGKGDFAELLLAMARDPAMLFWLDGMHNQRGAANENFARELLELFTLGIGAYSEKDVQETARAFTGWGLRFLIYEKGGENVQEVAKDCARSDRPMVAFAFSPALHDDGEKTILGQKKKWTGEMVIETLANRPETARLLARKLWEFFAYPEPEAAIIERLAKVYLDSKRNIAAMLRTIAKSPEFWSDKCVRKQVKSPVDFVVPIARQLGLGPFLLAAHSPKPTPMKPLAKPLRDIGGAVVFLCNEQGMLLLFPPDVAGWNWGQAWISTDSMTSRVQLGNLLMGIGSNDHGGAVALGARMNQVGSLKDPAAIVDAYMKALNAEIPSEKVAVLLQACQSNGGPGAFAKPDTTAKLLAAMNRLLFASPEFQLC